MQRATLHAAPACPARKGFALEACSAQGHPVENKQQRC